MKLAFTKQCITSDSEYNILDLFLEIINQKEEKCEQVAPCEVSENNLVLSSNFQTSESQHYFQFKNQNIVKNLLKSFQRYIANANNEEQKILLRISQKNYIYFQLKKAIKRSFKTFGKRWNMKLKHLLEKSTFKALFQFYLKHKSSDWLDLSKVQNKKEHMTVIEFLLESIEIPELSNQIKYYQKHKKSVICE